MGDQHFNFAANLFQMKVLAHFLHSWRKIFPRWEIILFDKFLKPSMRGGKYFFPAVFFF